jgi:hypothetical protein
VPEGFLRSSAHSLARYDAGVSDFRDEPPFLVARDLSRAAARGALLAGLLAAFALAVGVAQASFVLAGLVAFPVSLVEAWGAHRAPTTRAIRIVAFGSWAIAFAGLTWAVLEPAYVRALFESATFRGGFAGVARLARANEIPLLVYVLAGLAFSFSFWATDLAFGFAPAAEEPGLGLIWVAGLAAALAAFSALTGKDAWSVAAVGCGCLFVPFAAIPGLYLLPIVYWIADAAETAVLGPRE